ncbi:hypothetical protein HKD28_06475 [Gluconobacter sp. LMG 1744]|uniref:hypothetical protein n=1 Tax=Gluconobacter cadivus TaxID=2728101 RepID=UPI0018857691|nr:hypothetical protein [Gluconobacter cadivus]MBF0891068.1 hypothetical protein [Gluconobacter cadivus]
MTGADVHVCARPSNGPDVSPPPLNGQIGLLAVRPARQTREQTIALPFEAGDTLHQHPTGAWCQ